MMSHQSFIQSYRVKTSVFFLLISAAGLACAEGGFQFNCAESLITNDTVLSAVCQDILGKNLHSTIDLNNYIAVKDGRLEWQKDGNYKPLTRFCHLHHEPYDYEHSVMECSAKNNEGFWVHTSIDLAEHIGNVNGNLVYQGP